METTPTTVRLPASPYDLPCLSIAFTYWVRLHIYLCIYANICAVPHSLLVFFIHSFIKQNTFLILSVVFSCFFIIFLFFYFISFIFLPVFVWAFFGCVSDGMAFGLGGGSGWSVEAMRSKLAVVSDGF